MKHVFEYLPHLDFCLVLRRLAYPCRICDLTLLFGRSPSQLSLIFKHVSNHIIDNFGQKLSSLDQAWINPQLFAGVTAEKGAPLKNCWGFIDATTREMDQPSVDQRQVFSGHKRKHVIKFQLSFHTHCFALHVNFHLTCKGR